MTRAPLERTRQRLQGAAIAGLTLGLIFLGTGLNRPTIANMRTVDLLHLLATGGMLGAGLAALFVNLVSRRAG